MRRRPCLDCGHLHTNPSRCGPCQSAYLARAEKARGTSTARGYGAAWQRLSRTILAAHRSAYGDLCPGHQIPPHPSADLTVDHIVPKARGGTDHPSNLQVLCRGCNARKRDGLGRANQ